jgi:AraC-like DNA-binding protein/mannose-6-phosphate isomerase-like protein (cupin superfamily)
MPVSGEVMNARSDERPGQSYDSNQHGGVFASSTRPEGFSRQHLVVLPDSVIAEMERNPLLKGLFPTASGWFPEAPGHLVQRENGVEEMILIMCLSGAGWVQFDDRARISVQADELLVILPGTPHCYGADEADPWSITWAHCRGEDLDGFAKLLGATKSSPLLGMPPGEFEKIGFSKIYEHLEHGYAPANLLASAARLRLAFAEINRLRLPEHRGARSAEEGLRKTIQWMGSHVEQRVALSNFAKLAGLSVPHFSALFRRKTGFAPIDYFLRLKVQRACQLLDTTSMRIEEVANAIGCADAYYFSRFFKKIVGLSPREYRRVPKG